MAYAIFLLGSHLGKCASVALYRLKNAVVAKTAGAVTLCGDNALYFALKNVQVFAYHKGYGCAKTGRAVSYTKHFRQHFVDVSLAVVSHATITCRINPRLTAQSVYFKSCVIAETIITIVLLNKHCFYLGVALYVVSGFRNVVMAAYVSQTQYFKLVANYFSKLFELIFVVGRKN